MPPDRPSIAAFIGVSWQDSARDMLIAAAFPWIESEADLDRSNRCAQVTTLNLCGFSNDEILGMLDYFPKLRSLFLDGTEVTEIGLATLPNREVLDTVTLKGPGPHLSALTWLSRCRGLKTIHVQRTDEPLDKMLATASRIPHMEHLSLIDSHASDDDVPLFAVLSGLKGLHIGGSRLSTDGLRALRKLLPKVDVSAG
jgi:hypothetical protein